MKRAICPEMLSRGQDEGTRTPVIGFPCGEERKEGKYHMLSNCCVPGTVQGPGSQSLRLGSGIPGRGGTVGRNDMDTVFGSLPGEQAC